MVLLKDRRRLSKRQLNQYRLIFEEISSETEPFEVVLLA
jgi:hypothetical protein